MATLSVKIRNISNLTDARYFAAWNISLLSFNLNSDYGDPIEIQKAKDIIGWIHGPKIIGTFSIYQNLPYIESCKKELNLDYIELIGKTSDFEGSQLEVEYYQLIITENDDFSSIQKAIFTLPSTSKVVLNFSHSQLNNYAEFIKLNSELLYIDAPFKTKELVEFIKTKQILSLQISGGIEEKVGFKSFDDYDELFESVEDFIY